MELFWTGIITFHGVSCYRMRRIEGVFIVQRETFVVCRGGWRGAVSVRQDGDANTPIQERGFQGIHALIFQSLIMLHFSFSFITLQMKSEGDEDAGAERRSETNTFLNATAVCNIFILILELRFEPTAPERIMEIQELKPLCDQEHRIVNRKSRTHPLTHTGHTHTHFLRPAANPYEGPVCDYQWQTDLNLCCISGIPS